MSTDRRPEQGDVARAPHVLRVGMIAPPFLPVPPPGYGGIERVVAALAEGLVARGHQVTVFAAPGSATSARLVTPLDTAPLLGDPGAVSDELFHVTVAYRAAATFDVIHDHTGTGPALGAVLGTATPVVHTLHGPWTSRARRFFGLVQDRVHLVAISASQQVANPGLRWAGMVHNGIEIDRYPYREAKEDFLVFLGRVSPEKRPELAIDIARRAGLPLVMVVKRSEPMERAYWDRVVAPRLGLDVTVLDQPPHATKVDLVARARAMLFPIDWPEPFGLVMIEAMACGTPVIARPLGAASEVVSHGSTGFLCSSVDEMVDSVAKTGDLDPAACRRSVERRFSAQAMVAGYERIYDRICDAATGADGRGAGDRGAGVPGAAVGPTSLSPQEPPEPLRPAQGPLAADSV